MKTLFVLALSVSLPAFAKEEAKEAKLLARFPSSMKVGSSDRVDVGYSSVYKVIDAEEGVVCYVVSNSYNAQQGTAIQCLQKK